MVKRILLPGIIGLLCCFATFASAAKKTYVLENTHLSRTLVVEKGVLSTRQIRNKQTGAVLVPTACNEFALRLSEGTDKEGTDRILTAKDFAVRSFRKSVSGEVSTYAFLLENKEQRIAVKVCYELGPHWAYTRKYLEITSQAPLVLEQVDVESMAVADACQNYRLKQITTRKSGGWKPGLGQPVYTTQSATFWGMEFPAASNTVADGLLSCGYASGRALLANHPYTTYRSVVGVADDKDFIDEAFYDYIGQIRKRPLRLQVQYNSWFDFGKRVSKELFAGSVRKVHRQLVTERGCNPLDAYVIDDGWENIDEGVSWADTVWKINKKFTPYFSASREEVRQAGGSKLGIWLSPAVLFGSNKMVARMGAEGLEALSLGMSMTGEKYMQKLEDRVVDLAQHGVSYFKFDGLFGHLNIRDMEIYGRGTPAMPQLGLQGFSSDDERLNNPKYDELKTYYLVAGTERLMQIFSRLHEVNPDIFIAITNGAYLSPWWLMYADVVWLINAGDAAKGKDRTDELVYRDHIYHQIWQQENTKFPMCAIFNHEPKKVTAGEDRERFNDYLFMNLSRGTGFVELYLKTDSLSATDWDVLAQGLKWAERAFPVFGRVRMHGGNPRKSEVYGYTAWNREQGYVSLHNPSAQPRSYQIRLDRKAGLLPGSGETYRISSALNGKPLPGKRQYRYGDILSVTLAPKEILLFDFTADR
ncbi:hypothetical protein [uncultured Bacteroides sp.]|uniref:hypothetical protein n=1 Tax=uncultured Bacteroides sp. TaxID=162156 RepID=UPI0025D66430|nr:hypothetical protein [uncultured Bacteroides sp.]